MIVSVPGVKARGNNVEVELPEFNKLSAANVYGCLLPHVASRLFDVAPAMDA